MSCDATMMVGSDARLGANAIQQSLLTALLAAGLLCAASVSAQTLYKYRGADGEWIFSDRPPDDGDVEETRSLSGRSQVGSVEVVANDDTDAVRFIATNRFHIPVEIKLSFERLHGVEYPHPDESLGRVLLPTSTSEVLTLAKLADGSIPAVSYRYDYIAGDPGAVHRTGVRYRVPYSKAVSFPVTQAYPDVVTHKTPDSYYAVDIAMPIGTQIMAARAGVVFDVSSQNFKSGLDPERDGPAANVVQIVHDDGSYAIYAHLNWNSIRVRPGDQVSRGQYIADSGNTGFSSGPHLHFAVLQNRGMRAVSVPFAFEGAGERGLVPRTGQALTAH